MTKNELKNWALSSYNEDCEDQLDYYINERKCEVGDKAYLYAHADSNLTEMEIIKIVRRMDDIRLYDSLVANENILIDLEAAYNATTSAEFITDNDCYLVWFK